VKPFFAQETLFNTRIQDLGNVFESKLLKVDAYVQQRARALP